jgi:anti-anti-sigma factor
MPGKEAFPMLEITITHTNGRLPVAVMHLKGVFDAAGEHIFDAQAQDLVTNGARNVLIDMTDVSFMSSIGIRAIHRLFYSLHPEGSKEFQRILDEGVRQGSFKAPHLKLLNPSRRVCDILTMMGVDMYIDILTGTVQEAMDIFLMQAVILQPA